jgi:hypothetical protein
MIDLLRTWLPQMIGYAEGLLDGRYQQAWSEGDHSRTSVYYSGELYEQVFGDLYADTMLQEARLRLAEHRRLLDALDHFLGSLKRLDSWIEAHVDTEAWGGSGHRIPTNVHSIFQSQQWCDAQSSAAKLVFAAGEVGFSSNHFDPAQ